MRSHSSTTANALKTSPQIQFSRVELVDDGLNVLLTFQVIDGAVNYSVGNGTVSSTVSMTVADTSTGGTPVTKSALSLITNRIRVFRGVQWTHSTTRQISMMGLFHVTDIKYYDTPTGRRIQISGRDSSIIVEKNQWIYPYRVPKGSFYADTARKIVDDRLKPYWLSRIPLGTLDGLNSAQLPETTYGLRPGGNPWNDATALAHIAAGRIFFDRDGKLTIRVIPNPSAVSPDLTLTTGEGGTVSRVTKLADHEQTYNHVTVVGEASGETKVRAEAEDTDTASPTYVGGAFGKRPLVITSQVISDGAVALDLAQRVLADVMKVYEEIEIEFIPYPHLEITDVVRLVHPPLRIDQNFLIRSLRVPLGEDELASAVLVNRLTETAENPTDAQAPSTPIITTAEAKGPNQVDLGWGASTDNLTGVASYRIRRGGTTLVAEHAGTSYSDHSVGENTTYSYTVSAVDKAGNRSAESDAVSVQTHDVTPPSVPVISSVAVDSGTSLTVNWNASSDNRGVASYRVVRDGVTVASAVTTLAFTDTGLDDATTYTYTVSAVDASGNRSAESAAVSQTTPDVTAPGVPQNVRGTILSATSVRIDWTASGDNVKTTEYRITKNGTVVANVTDPTWTDTAVVEGTTHTYTVAARDAAGNYSSDSTGLSVLTDETAPSVPQGLSASVHGAQINLGWLSSTDNVGVTGYRLMRNGATRADNIDGTGFEDTTVERGVEYTYTVSALDMHGNRSAESAPATATVPLA